MRDAFIKLKKLGKVQAQDQELTTGDITLWKDLLESQVTSLQIDQICGSVDKVINEMVCLSSFSVLLFFLV